MCAKIEVYLACFTSIVLNVVINIIDDIHIIKSKTKLFCTRNKQNFFYYIYKKFFYLFFL